MGRLDAWRDDCNRKVERQVCVIAHEPNSFSDEFLVATIYGRYRIPLRKEERGRCFPTDSESDNERFFHIIRSNFQSVHRQIQPFFHDYHESYNLTFLDPWKN